MSARVVKLEESTHQKVQRILPWFALGTLSTAEQTLIQAHLATCVECRADLAWQAQLQAYNVPRPPGLNVERAFAAMTAQLPLGAASAEAITTFASQSAQRSRNVARWWERIQTKRSAWLGLLAAAQGLAITAMALLLIVPAHQSAETPSSFRALSNNNSESTQTHHAQPDTAQAGNVVAMFKPDTTERELRGILQASGARIVDGPTVTDSYVLYVPEAQREASIASLRAQRAVMLAVSLESGDSDPTVETGISRTPRGH